MATIEYRNQNNQMVARMNDVANESAELVAQKYMNQFPDLTAHIFTATSERIVSRATEWQKRNG